MLVEGSFINKGVGVKETAESTTDELGRPVRFIPASSEVGIAAYVMTQSLNKAA
jgi:hypothetical protein